MRDLLELTGMVMKSTPVGEYDKRLVILTRQRGKITAFARGARRPGSMLMGPSRPFAFGTFRLFERRDSYNLQGAEITQYFDELASDMEGTCYGQYFLEFADYYAREGLEGTAMLLLLYQSMRALLKPSIPNSLIRRIFELKVMVLNGEYTEHPPKPVGDSANYAWEYVVAMPPEKLYNFVLREDAFREFAQCVEEQKNRYVDRRFHSLEILQVMCGGF